MLACATWLAVGRKLLPAGPRLAARAMSSLEEKTVKVTFVNLEGKRLTVPGLVGQNLLDVAKMHKVELDGPCGGVGNVNQARHTETWTEDLFGEGPKCNCCHVMITREFYEHVEPPFPAETKMLETLGEGLYSPGSSRLGCQVTLDKSLDGITVYIPDGPPIDGC